MPSRRVGDCTTFALHRSRLLSALLAMGPVGAESALGCDHPAAIRGRRGAAYPGVRCGLITLDTRLFLPPGGLAPHQYGHARAAATAKLRSEPPPAQRQTMKAAILNQSSSSTGYWLVAVNSREGTKGVHVTPINHFDSLDQCNQAAEAAKRNPPKIKPHRQAPFIVCLTPDQYQLTREQQEADEQNQRPDLVNPSLNPVPPGMPPAIAQWMQSVPNCKYGFEPGAEPMRCAGPNNPNSVASIKHPPFVFVDLPIPHQDLGDPICLIITAQSYMPTGSIALTRQNGPWDRQPYYRFLAYHIGLAERQLTVDSALGADGTEQEFGKDLKIYDVPQSNWPCPLATWTALLGGARVPIAEVPDRQYGKLRYLQ